MLEPIHEKGRIIEETSHYQGHIYEDVTQIIETPDHLTVHRDLIKHQPAVAILALTPDHQQVVINREYRVGVNQEVYALPAGLINAGETAEAAAKRELTEETGYVVQELHQMTAIRSSEGMTDEVVTLFWAVIDSAKRQSTNFDKDEFVTANLVPLTDLIDAVQTGVVASAQSVAAVSYFLAFEQNK